MKYGPGLPGNVVAFFLLFISSSLILLDNLQRSFNCFLVYGFLSHSRSDLGSTSYIKIPNVISKNRTTIVIAHRLSTILNSDTIYVIDNGKVVAEGNHNELLNNSAIYKNFYEKQIRKN